MPKTNKRVDLTDKGALVAAFNKHHTDLWAAFGTAPLYKDYDTNRLLDFIDALIKKENVHISPEKKEEIFDNIKKKGKNVKLVLQYVANVFLKGAGLGLGESKEQLLRKVIREEIRVIIREAGADRISTGLSKYYYNALKNQKSNTTNNDKQLELDDKQRKKIADQYVNKYKSKIVAKYDEYFKKNPYKKGEPDPTEDDGEFWNIAQFNIMSNSDQKIADKQDTNLTVSDNFWNIVNNIAKKYGYKKDFASGF